MWYCRVLIVGLSLGAFLPQLPSRADEGASPPNATTFEKDVWPIFRAHCFDCHGATDEPKGSLDLRLVRFMQQGGDSGASLTPGKPEESLLLDRIRSGEMPPGESSVPKHEIAVIEEWIVQGAKTARPEPESIGPGIGITPEERSFWSFQPVARLRCQPSDRFTPVEPAPRADVVDATLASQFA